MADERRVVGRSKQVSVQSGYINWNVAFHKRLRSNLAKNGAKSAGAKKLVVQGDRMGQRTI